METKWITTETWLSRPSHPRAFDFSLFLLALLFLGSFAYLGNYLHAEEWMPATRAAVFERGEFWRTLTTLFAHADLAHILGNAFLFLPFSYFLSGFFGFGFFPLFGFFCGALVNAIVLLTMPPEASLIGVSGVLYWMGAAWLTLYLRIERHEPARRRWGKVIVVTAALFIPQTFEPQVSYLSHLLGFLFGIASGLGYFAIFRRKILAAEKRELLVLEPLLEEEQPEPEDEVS